MKQFYVFLCALVLGVSGISAHAQEAPTPGVYLSEINWAGSPLSQADEWIELVNTSSETVDVSGWILTGVATGGEALMIEDGTVIDPDATLVIANYDLGEKGLA